MPLTKPNESKLIRNTFYAQLIAFILSSLTQTLGSLIDGVVIGRCLGVDSMAAFGLISPLMVTFSIFGAIISKGARNRYTRLIGEGKMKEAQSVFSLSVMLSIGLAGVLMLLIFLFATPFTELLGASGNAAHLMPKARDYLISVTIGLPAINLMKILTSFLPIDNDRELPVISSIVLSAADIILDLIVAFVIHGDTFEMGMATTISYYLATAVMLLHFRKKNTLLRFSFRNILWNETGNMIYKGLPSGICRLGNTVRSSFMNHLLSVIASSAAIAAYSVHRQADSLLNPITIGMADTVAMIAGILMGEEDRPKMKRLLFTSLHATCIITLGVSVIAWLASPLIAAMYIKDNTEALEYSISAVRAYALGMPLYGLNLIYQNYLEGTGKSKLSSLSGSLNEVGVTIISAYTLSHLIGAGCVWYAFPVTQAVMIVINICLALTYDHINGIKQGKAADKLLLVPDTFDSSEYDRMDRTISTAEEVTILSREVWDFCTEHGCENRQRYLLSLSVEEMAGNIIKHGFSHDEKSHSIDVRIIKKQEGFLVRIRDDCLIFDPVNQLKLYSEEDRMHHMGLRMIITTAKDVQYTSILKLNNLLIKL